MHRQPRPLASLLAALITVTWIVQCFPTTMAASTASSGPVYPTLTAAHGAAIAAHPLAPSSSSRSLGPTGRPRPLTAGATSRQVSAGRPHAALARLSRAAPRTARMASSPATGTLSPGSSTITYVGAHFTANNTTGQPVNSTPTCANPALQCDDFTLNVQVPSDPVYTSTHTVNVFVAYPDPAFEYDIYIFDATGALVKSTASGSDPSLATIPAVAGVYTITVVPFNNDPSSNPSYTATVSLNQNAPAAAPAPQAVPSFGNYAAPSNGQCCPNANNAGEPSIGVNWNTGAVMYKANNSVLRVAFTGPITAAVATWQDKSYAGAVTSVDPILFTDHTTGRTLTSDLQGDTCSFTGFTDNDGDSYLPSQGCGFASGVDHQTVGGGPFAPATITATFPITYPHAIYYCSQNLEVAQCALSRDGGVTFTGNGAAVPIYNFTQCVGIHGHVKVAPDGTVYVPNRACGARQGVAMSTDNGLTWTVHQVPDSTSADWDPSIGIGTNRVGQPGTSTTNTIYFGYQNGNGHPQIAVSHDHGLTWSPSVDVGASFGIQNSVFPAVVAGDDNRAAFAFLGTPTGGDYSATGVFTGIWHLYVAYTYDGGATWVTTDATPNDPVQRGSICNKGTLCPVTPNDRNLLDFMDATVTKQGRVLVGYADGCIASCDQGGDAGTNPNSFSAYATIARQTQGLGLFAQYDSLLGGPTPTATSTAVKPTKTPTTIPTSTLVPTVKPTKTATSTPTSTATVKPTKTPTTIPTSTLVPTAKPTKTPTSTATSTATIKPTKTPTKTPTSTLVPTVKPTKTATSTPTSTRVTAFMTALPLLANSGTNPAAAEPSIRVDTKGNIYVTGPAGVPTGGCPAWRVHPGSLSATGLPYEYLGKFDIDHNGPGGGDCDIATGGYTGTTGFDNLAVSSLSLANLTVNQSSDGGNTFHTPANSAGVQTPGLDRQWNAADSALGQVYMTVHDAATDNIQNASSIDGGYTYHSNPIGAITTTPGSCGISTGCFSAATMDNHFGNIVVDPATHKLYTVYVAPADATENAQAQQPNATSPNEHVVYVAIGNPCALSCTPGLPIPLITWTDEKVYTATVGDDLAHIFPVIGIDTSGPMSGTVYIAWSDDPNKGQPNHIFLTHSVMPHPNAQASWTAPVQVDQNASHSNMFPWLVAGTSGALDVVWYQAQLGTTPCPAGEPTTDSNGVNNNCHNVWSVQFAQSLNANANHVSPTFTQVPASGVMHRGSLCDQGLNCNLFGGDRTLADFFQVDLDQLGAANIAYASDAASPGTPLISYTRQCGGHSATGGPAIIYSCASPLPPPPSSANSCTGQNVITDTVGDAGNPLGLPDPANNNGQVDIKAVSFTTDSPINPSILTSTMVISNLTATPIPGTTDTYYYVVWTSRNGRMYATLADAPDPNASDPTKPFAFSYGQFDPSTNQLISSTVTSTSGAVTLGPNGAISVTVPLSAIGNPTIPVTSGGTPAVIRDFALTFSGVGALGSGLIYTRADDRAPNQGFGARFAVCPKGS